MEKNRHLLRAMTLILVAGLVAAPAEIRATRAERLDLRRLELEIGGPPVAIVPADVNADGRTDLLVVTAYTYWGQSSETVVGELDGRRYEEVRIVPTLVDRREMQLWLAAADDGYRPASPPQRLPPGVVAVDVGPAAQPILALTESGIAALRHDAGTPGAALTLEPLIETVTLLAGTGALLPDYRFTDDVDGDGAVDVLLPVPDGVAVHLSRGGRVDPRASSRLSLPGDESGKDGVVWRRFSRPSVQDVQGDGVPDLVVFRHVGEGFRLTADTERGFDAVSVLPGLGGGRFGPPVHLVPAAGSSAEGVSLSVLDDGSSTIAVPEDVLRGSLSFFGDLDGDGVAELVTQDEVDESGGFRKEMRHAKRPDHVYRFFHLGADFVLPREPYLEFRAEGYPFDFDWLDASPGGFQDLDGDGLMDLVTVSLDFSLWQAPKILIARSIGAGLDFHVWRQGASGAFREVPQARLRGKLKVDLARARLGQFAQFAGDFDGDGHTDFVRLGSERTVDIHRGAADCRYPRKADLSLRLESSPADPGLVRVRDVDGDGRSDLIIVTPLEVDEQGESRPTRLEFYLTGGRS